MLKYYNYMVVFEEIPDEITLSINITNCPCHCIGCHSKFLWEDVGTELTVEELGKIIDENSGVSCVCFMGGDAAPSELNELACYVRKEKKKKVGWYSGRDVLSNEVDLRYFNYVKIGRYDEKLGGLDKETTNQVLYKISPINQCLGNNDDIQKTDNTDRICKHGTTMVLEDITDKFWKKPLAF